MFKSLGLHKVCQGSHRGFTSKAFTCSYDGIPSTACDVGELTFFLMRKVEGCESHPFQSWQDDTYSISGTFHSEFRFQAIEGELVGHDVGIWFLSWLVESLSFRWVHAQQLRPLTVDVEPVTEKKSTSTRSCYTFGLEPPYLDLLRYIFL